MGRANPPPPPPGSRRDPVTPTAPPGTPPPGPPPARLRAPVGNDAPTTLPTGRETSGAARPAPILAPDRDTVVELGRRWEPPLDGAPTPVVRILAESEPPPAVPSAAAAASPPVPQRAAVPPPIPSSAFTPERPSLAVATAVAPPLEDAPPGWLSSRKTARQLPKGVKLGLVAAVALVALLVLAARCGGTTPAAAISSTVYDHRDAMVVNADQLRKRKEMTADDFRPSRGVGSAGTSPAAPTADVPADAGALTIDDQALAERRARRDDNPEDLHASARRSEDRERRVGQDDTTSRPGRSYFLVLESPADTRAAVEDQGVSASVRRVPAASRVRATLVQDLMIRGSSANAVAQVVAGQRLPVGTKLVGRARADRDGFIQIHFRTAVLPSGDSMRVDAEAQDADGAVGVRGAMVGAPAVDEQDSSVLAEVADSTARRAAVSVLGGGLLGGAVEDTFRARDRADSRPRHRGNPVVRLARETPIYAFFLSEAVRER